MGNENKKGRVKMFSSRIRSPFQTYDFACTNTYDLQSSQNGRLDHLEFSQNMYYAIEATIEIVDQYVPQKPGGLVLQFPYFSLNTGVAGCCLFYSGLAASDPKTLIIIK